MSGQEFFESEADDSDEELLMAQSKANFGSVEAKLELLERVKDTLQLKLTRRSRRMREMGQIMANSAEKMQQKCQIIADQKAKIHNLEKNLIQTSLTFQRYIEHHDNNNPEQDVIPLSPDYDGLYLGYDSGTAPNSDRNPHSEAGIQPGLRLKDLRRLHLDFMRHIYDNDSLWSKLSSVKEWVENVEAEGFDWDIKPHQQQQQIQGDDVQQTC